MGHQELKQKVKANMRGLISTLMGAAIVVGATAAGAQDLTTTQVAPVMTTSTVTSTGGSITDTSGATDHSVVVGHLGLRYFGTAPMPTLSFTGGMVGMNSTQDLHTVGARYWLNNAIGIEAGLGIGFASGSTTLTQPTMMGSQTNSSDIPNFFGIGLQVGLPIMMAESKHLAIHLDPYLAFRYSTSGITSGSGPATTDDKLSGFQFALGANAVAELQFGFIGLPQLGLQAQFGFGLTYNNSSRTSTVVASNTVTTVSNSTFSIGTTVGPHYGLDQIINGSIAAVWYFGAAPGR